MSCSRVFGFNRGLVILCALGLATLTACSTSGSAETTTQDTSTAVSAGQLSSGSGESIPQPGGNNAPNSQVGQVPSEGGANRPLSPDAGGVSSGNNSTTGPVPPSRLDSGPGPTFGPPLPPGVGLPSGGSGGAGAAGGSGPGSGGQAVPTIPPIQSQVGTTLPTGPTSTLPPTQTSSTVNPVQLAAFTCEVRVTRSGNTNFPTANIVVSGANRESAWVELRWPSSQAGYSIPISTGVGSLTVPLQDGVLPVAITYSSAAALRSEIGCVSSS
jgi:hypothetical protein